MIDRKKRFQNKDFLHREEDTGNGETAERDVIERAKAAGIDPRPILDEINSAVNNVTGSRSEGVCTNTDAERIKKVLLEKIQEFLKKYHISGLEIGSYSDPYVMDGYTQVRIFLGSGTLYEVCHDGRTQFIELYPSVLAELHSPKRIVHNLLDALIDMTQKNRTKIREIEEATNLQTSQGHRING